MESIRNSLRLFEKWKVLGYEPDKGSRVVLLEFPFSNDERLLSGVELFLADFLHVYGAHPSSSV